MAGLVVGERSLGEGESGERRGAGDLEEGGGEALRLALAPPDGPPAPRPAPPPRLTPPTPASHGRAVRPPAGPETARLKTELSFFRDDFERGGQHGEEGEATGPSRA